VRRGAAGHRNRLEAVELVAQWLPLFPGEELLRAHRLTQCDGHQASLARFGIVTSTAVARMATGQEAGGGECHSREGNAFMHLRARSDEIFGNHKYD
jgi:folate-dependent tRNA-U54 methylase TrmFO/GidA